ncbi:hypothetical protein [Spongiibacter marinus]|uniref:hypothetical protein n=1 Tax=Spongiibacter marinus TaxID=354246 RepID=UPI003C4C1F74
MKKIICLIISFLLISCAEIQHYETVSVPLNIPQTTSLGSELYRISRTRDLPNVFGKADIYGGKVNEGYSELRFMGLTDSGSIIFQLTDIDIESNETVFTRYGRSTSTVNSNTTANISVYGNTAYGSAKTNTTISHYDKPEAIITQLPLNTVRFEFDPNEKLLELDGISVEIIEVKKYSIKYMLHKKIYNLF